MGKNAFVKFSGQMEQGVREDLEEYAKTSGKSLSSIYNEMAILYLRSKRIRPIVLQAAHQVMVEDAELLTRLAK